LAAASAAPPVAPARVTAAPPASTAPATSSGIDPYQITLLDCMRRTRDGEPHAACRFARPLDEMDFGQKHCDAKCAELAR
jgi:hypothetical protein